MIKLDAQSHGVLIHRYLAKTSFTKFSPIFSYKKVGKKHERYQKIEYTQRGYKIQWKNILNDLLKPVRNAVRLAEFLGVPRKFAHQLGAIAFDAGSHNSSNDAGTSITVSHTCTGSNRVMVGYILSAGNGTESMTYAGTDMGAKIGSSSSNYVDGIFALAAPATGANDLVFSISQSDAPRVVAGTSLTGAAQSDVVDGSTFGGETNTTQTITITTAVANSMVCDFLMGYNSTKVWTVDAAQTEIKNEASQNAYRYCSSYRAAPTAGGIAMTWTREGGAPSAYSNHSGVGIKELVATTATTIRRRQII